MLELRPAGNASAPFYNPARDIVHLYPAILKSLVPRLRDDPDLVVRQLIWQLPSDDADVLAAFTALCKAHSLFVNQPAGTPCEDLLEQAGFFRCTAAAQAIVVYTLGRAVMDVYLAAMRNVSGLVDFQDVDSGVQAALAAGGSWRSRWNIRIRKLLDSVDRWWNSGR